MNTVARNLLRAGCLALIGLSGCGPPPEAEDGGGPMLIEPRVSVGEIKTGMSAQEVVKRLGEPQRRTANALEYTRLGFAVMPDRDGIVQVVMCGDVTGITGPLVKSFRGKTKEGAGLGSSREEIVRAFGEPEKAERLSMGRESLQYEKLGITFSLEGGKVHHMIVRLQPYEERPAAIEVIP